MKKIFSFALLAAMMLTSATLLTACGDDDDDNGGGGSIVGEWVTASESSSYMLTEIMQFNANGTLTDTTYELYGTGLTSSNPKLTSLDKDVDSGTYSVDGNKLYMTFYGETQTFTYSISKSGQNLTITYSNSSQTQSITFERMTSQERQDIASIEEIWQQMHE